MYLVLPVYIMCEFIFKVRICESVYVCPCLHAEERGGLCRLLSSAGFYNCAMACLAFQVGIEDHSARLNTCSACTYWTVCLTIVFSVLNKNLCLHCIVYEVGFFLQHTSTCMHSLHSSCPGCPDSLFCAFTQPPFIIPTSFCMVVLSATLIHVYHRILSTKILFSPVMSLFSYKPSVCCQPFL